VIYNLTDTFWVGRLGADAVSAISFAFPVVFLMIGAAGGFTAGGSILVAQAVGSNEPTRARIFAGQTLCLTALFSVVIASVGYFLTPLLLELIGTPPGTGIFEMAVAYTRVMFLGNFAIFGFFVFQSVLRGWGDTQTPLYLMAFGVGLNLLVDPVFILGFAENPIFEWLGLGGLEASLLSLTGFRGLGIEGAAVATITARGLGTAIGIGLLYRGRSGLSLGLGDLRLHAGSVRRLVSVAWPLAIERTLTPISITAITVIVATVGPAAVAGYGIGTRYVALVFLPAIGLANATEAAVGQNSGAGLKERARQVTLLSVGLIGGIMLPMTAIFVFFSEPLVSVFVTGTGAQAVVGHGTDFLRVFAVAFPFLGTLRIIVAAFGGVGHSRKALTISLLRVFALQIPLPLGLLALGFEAAGIWYGTTIAVIVATVFGGTWFFTDTWRTESETRDMATTTSHD
jgi:putative MATE family efflux protein